MSLVVVLLLLGGDQVLDAAHAQLQCPRAGEAGEHARRRLVLHAPGVLMTRGDIEIDSRESRRRRCQPELEWESVVAEETEDRHVEFDAAAAFAGRLELLLADTSGSHRQ